MEICLNMSLTIELNSMSAMLAYPDSPFPLAEAHPLPI